MKRKTKIIIIVAVIAVVLLPIYLLNAVNKKIKERDNTNTNVVESKNEITEEKNNTVENVASNETNTNISENELANTVDNEIVNESTNNTVTNETISNTTISEEVSVSNPKEKAMQIAKKDWGEDDTVYFRDDGIDGSGNYLIAVEDKERNYVKCWYHINVKDGTFTVTK